MKYNVKALKITLKKIIKNCYKVLQSVAKYDNIYSTNKTTEEKYMRYFVIASRWNEKKEKIVKEIVGEFNERYFATLFMLAYNKEYKSDAEVVEESDLLNR